ncbi:hypothetical protein CWE23_02535 [Idiomarina aquatica]|uniref:Uncharacterized protein n=1 Tax=Idiomarina aquatica TaxID=1327752 RepID=A0AA94EH34_9GAMM|nr:hypothetical protein CWE23_02535 [Idiomarina aquatica]
MRPAIMRRPEAGMPSAAGFFRYRGRMRLAIDAALGGGNFFGPDRHARLRLAKPMGTHDLGAMGTRNFSISVRIWARIISISGAHAAGDRCGARRREFFWPRSAREAAPR